MRESRPASTRVVLIHGAATTSRVWRHVIPLLTEAGGLDVSCPDRMSSGDLAAEVAALRDVCHGAILAGGSGGATLGLALAAPGVSMRAALIPAPAPGAPSPRLPAQAPPPSQAPG